MRARRIATLTLLLAAALGSVAAPAKDGSPDVVPRSPEQVLAGTITSGTVTWVNNSTTWTATGTGPTHNFTIAAQDQVFQDWWWYRAGADTRESTLPTPSSEAYAGDLATFTWTNFNGSGLDAVLLVRVADNPARVTHTLTVSNPTAAAINFTAFRYVDFDLNGTTGSDSATLTISPSVMTVTDGARTMPLSAAGAANYAVTTFATLRGLLANTAIDNLGNTGLPFGPGDFTGGFQWATRSIPAGGSTVYSSQYGAPVENVYGITGAAAGASLVRFTSDAPGIVTTVGALSGIVAGHSVRAIDFRPANGQLYALSTNATNGYQLYTVNLTTGALTPVGPVGTVTPNFPARVSMDFNPAVDRLRVITGSNASYRINPNDGALAGTDTNTAYVAGDPNAGQTPFPAGVAYDRNDNDPGTPTTLFLYDFNNDALSRVGGVDGTPSPNGGGLTTIFEPGAFVTNDAGLGFDVATAGTAYLSYAAILPGQERAPEGGGSPETFATISLTTGALSVIGSFQAGTDMLDIAVVPTAPILNADLAVTLADNPDPVNAGSNLSYTLTVTNNGPAAANDVAASLPLPAPLVFVSATPSTGGNCTGTSTVACSWAGATAAAASRSVVVVASVPAATAAGTVINTTGSGTSASIDPNGANNSAAAATTVAVSADLSITLADAPDPVTAGTQLTYTAIVSNAGPSDASGVSVNLPTPTGTSFVSGTVSGGGSCAAGISCTVTGSIAPGSSRTITITVLVAPSVLSGSVVNATATVTATSPDPNAGNNTATTATSVNASADLQIGFTSSHTQVLINVPVTFTATSLNNGPSDAQNVSITLTLTPDFRYSSHTATGATCTTPQIGNTGAIVCTWAGPTAPGVTRTLSVVAFSNVEGNTAVNASTTSSTTDPNTGNNQASLAVVVGYPFQEIPTLSGHALVLLGLLLGLIGFVAVRRQA